MRTGELMSSEVGTIQAGASLLDAAHAMRTRGVHHLPVTAEGRLVGLLSAEDLDAAWPSAATTLTRGEIHGALARVPVEAVMARDVVTLRPETPILEAARLMRDWSIRALPVVNRGQVVGVLTEHDLVAKIPALLGESHSPGT